MSGKSRILIADDEPHIRRILQFLLEAEGFEVELAEDGQQAVEKVFQWRPELVMLDVMMPHLDGFAVLQRIRSNFETARTPVIMLTAKGELEDKVKGLEGGANDYIIKPFEHAELVLRARNLLNSQRWEREANPLTGLPGNRAIERETSQRIASGAPFAFMYIDIDRFKSFNDYYGFRKGDEAISFLADILRTCSQAYGSAQDFIGHVGGDDFVMITLPDCAEDLGRKIIENFDLGVAQLHEMEDLQRGYLEVKNRSGAITRFPLITLTIALVGDAQGRFAHQAALSDTMAELKRYGKTLESSVMVCDRRQGGGSPECVVSAGLSAMDIHGPGQ
ncbi:diguanylate cyclase response regulator [bacterium DOLZORAL124_64_63]|nr:MAG: diguanylate cyclase response regulator [bacterium DOLZORAL124_64_63]